MAAIGRNLDNIKVVCTACAATYQPHRPSCAIEIGRAQAITVLRPSHLTEILIDRTVLDSLTKPAQAAAQSQRSGVPSLSLSWAGCQAAGAAAAQ